MYFIYINTCLTVYTHMCVYACVYVCAYTYKVVSVLKVGKLFQSLITCFLPSCRSDFEGARFSKTRAYV